MPAGARAEAMGGAAAAAVRGPDSIFWNPAGLARDGSDVNARTPAFSELSLGYSALLETAYSGSAAYAVGLGRAGVIGVGLLYFTQSSLTSYNATGDPTGRFAPNDMALSLAYADRLSEGLLVGAAAKFLRSSVAEASGASGAVDVGVQALRMTEVGGGPVDVGGSLSNLGPPLKVGAASSPLPLLLRGGFAWHAAPGWLAALDLNMPSDQDLYTSFGLEAAVGRAPSLGFLRVGYNQNHGRKIDGLAGLTAGAGLDFKGLRLDYAWVPFGDLGTTNRVSLAFRF